MVVTPDTVVVGVEPDIADDQWKKILQDADSPALLGGVSDGWKWLSILSTSLAYDVVVQHRISPAFALAVFKHESRFGTVGLVPQHNLKNPGARRSTVTGMGEEIQIPGRGQFVRYRTWRDGWEDLAVSLTDPNHVYDREGRVTIKQIIERWAPSSDGNVPESYIAAVVKSMNEWTGDDTVPDYTWHECLIAEGRRNRPGHALTPTYITIHETANTRAGADAASHCDYIRSDAAANRPASWHVTVDDHSAYQHLPYDEVAWHAGDGATGTGNRNSLSIELCVNDDGDWEQTMRNAARIVRGWMDQFAIPIQNIVQHNHWSSTSCPARLRAGDWARFIGMVTGEEDERFINGYPVRGPFLQAYRILAGIGAHWWTVGVPLGAEIESVEVDGIERTVQEFDRVWLMTEDGGVVVAMPHQVTQIQEAIGMGDGFNLRLQEIATAAEAILNNARAMGG